MGNWIKPQRPARRIGLVGAGTMGRCMLERMLGQGFEVSVFDVSPSAVEAAAGLGAGTAESPRSLAEGCEAIIMSLPGPKQLEAVMFGENGIAAALRPGQVVADTSTVDPDTTRGIASRIADTGAAYLDCPVLGRPSAAGKWLLPAGGCREAAEWIEPVLLSFAARVIPAGDSGAGNALKLLNQLMYSVINAVTAETLAIADRVGVGRGMFYETVAGSSAATVSGLFRESGRNIVDGDFSHPAFTVDLLIKDASLALKMADMAGAPALIAGGVQGFNELARAKGLGGSDVAALYRVFADNYEGTGDADR